MCPSGVKGFEPLNVGSKFRCLTTWRHPTRETLSVMWCFFFGENMAFPTELSLFWRRACLSFLWYSVSEMLTLCIFFLKINED